jgi:hypothetical protein
MAAAAAALLALAPAAFMVLGPGCGSGSSKSTPEEACTTGCDNYVRLGCNMTCDCSKCAQLPASCKSSDFSCTEAATTCTAMMTCPAPAASDCATFVGTFCK